MISRVYVWEKGEDIRGKLCLASWAEHAPAGSLKKVSVVDGYLIESRLGREGLLRAAAALANPVSESYAVNKLPDAPFDWCIEIGFKPGVTDNAGHTARETIADLLNLKKGQPLAVYTSKIFLISGRLAKADAERIAASLHNPLIERATIIPGKELARVRTLPQHAPRVILPKSTPVIKVPLAVPDDELVRIGKEGILGPDKARRGPLALDLASMHAIQAYFRTERRDPTDIEIESLAQTWSEHCKHTIFADPIDDVRNGLYRTYIKGATNLIRKRKGKKDFCISVFSDNSGGIVFDDEYMITHKVETHNSPSALDPFGGAITGIVGVNRDAIGFGLGAKPVANAYGFCFGKPDDLRPLYRDKALKQRMFPPRRIMDGVIRGINTGGNCSGIPTVSGFVRFDDRYRGKPLVFAGTVGIIPRTVRGKPSEEKAARPGDYIVVAGGRVGADGIHGATFSSVALDSSSPATAVQIGDPITQKKLSDAVVKEARDQGLYHSITDNGAGGISCSVAEMAKECGGAAVDLEKVPLKYPGLEPWQIWISESQERMTLAVPPKNWKKFKELMERRGVEAVVIGAFNASGRMAVRWHGKKIMDISLEFLHNGLPKHALQSAETVRMHREPALPKGLSRTAELEQLMANNNIGGYSFISEQYDHEVQAGSVLKPLSGAGRINTDAQVFRPVLSSKKAAVVSTGVYPSYGDVSAYRMAAAAIDTAVRSAVAAGAPLGHLAILDNFCWCSSYEPERLFELHEALKACYDYSVAYGTPLISGKDSMFNDFRGFDEKGNPLKISIPPTLLITSIAVMPDAAKTVSPEFKSPGDFVYVLGDTDAELGGGEYYKLLAGKMKRAKNETEGSMIGSSVPTVDAKKNMRTYRALERAIGARLVASSISVTSGGLAVALARAAAGGMKGCEVSLAGLPGKAKTADQKLFSESQGRIVVSVAPKNARAFEKILKGASFKKIGRVSGGKKFVIKDAKNTPVRTDISRLHKAYHSFSNKMK